MAKKASSSLIAQRALVVGVSGYSPPVASLPAVANDVREMAKLLSSRNGAFRKETVKTLTDKAATRDAVLAGLDEALSKAGRDETVFVYLAGHGTVAGARYFFLPYDVDVLDIEKSCVPLTTIKSMFDRCESRRVFLWMDFCHSGGILARGSQGDAMNAVRRTLRAVQGQGKVIVAACTSTQSAFESSSIGHGLFTHALLRGLKGAAKSAQGEVTAASLYDFIDHQIVKPDQQPVFFGEMTGRIVLMHFDKRTTGKITSAPKKLLSSRPQKATAKIKGSWIMLADDFLVAERIRNHSDGTIELAITPQSGEHEAALAALRPNQYGGGRELSYAANSDACQVRVDHVVNENLGGKQIWNVKLTAVERQPGFAQEVNVQGIGPDEIARRRVGRILLNDPAPPTATRSTGYSQSSFIEHFISGSMTGFQIKECVVRSMYQQHGQSTNWKEFARLKAIYLLKMSGTIEHVLELKIGAVRGGEVSVSFRGRRPRRYSNAVPENIELHGKCALN